MSSFGGSGCRSRVGVAERLGSHEVGVARRLPLNSGPLNPGPKAKLHSNAGVNHADTSPAGVAFWGFQRVTALNLSFESNSGGTGALMAEVRLQHVSD